MADQKKKLDLVPLDLQPVEDNAGEIIDKAKQVLAVASPSFNNSVDKHIEPVKRDQFSGDYLEPTTFAGGFLKSIKDQIIGAGTSGMEDAARLRGKDTVDTLSNIGNLLLPSGMEGAVNAGRELLGKGKGNLGNIAEAAKSVELPKDVQLPNELKVSSSLPKTEQPILDTDTIRQAKLPHGLSGAKPRYRYGQVEHIPVFESDIDKAAFITAQKNPSKADAAYLKFVMDNTGLDEAGARNYGMKVRNQLKNTFKGNKEGGAANIPHIGHDISKPIEPPPTNFGNNIVDDSGRDLGANAQTTDDAKVYPNYPKKEDDIFKRMGMGIEKPENGKLPIRIKNGKQYLKEINKENVDKIYNAGYELGNDGEIVKKSVEKPLTPPVDNAPINFSTKGKKTLDLQPVDVSTGEIKELPTSETKLPTNEQVPPNKPPEEILASTDKLPPDGPPKITKQPSKLQQWWNVSRDLMSTDLPFTTSAAFRQGSTQVGTIPWLQAWGKAAVAYGSKGASEMMEAARLNNPLFKETLDAAGKRIPSLAEEAGLRTGDFNRYDNPHVKQLAEQIPIYGKHIVRSNRAFNAFINHIMEAKFTSLVDDGEKLAQTARETGKARPGFFKIDAPNPDLFDPKKNLPLAKEIAGLVNTSLKRGNVGIEAIKWGLSFEKHAQALSNIFFSPRNMASEVRMLNPSTYIMASPEIRKAYMANMTRRLAMWTSIAGLAKSAGAQVSLDPTNADFGKIKIGDHRLDLPGGLQQFLVLAARMRYQGTTSSTSDNAKFRPFGTGYPPETTGSTIGRFMANRLHPNAKFALDAAFADPKHVFHSGDRITQLAAPMFADDMTDVFKNNPELSSIEKILYSAGMGTASSVGIGTQSYDRNSFGKSKYIPEKYDFNIGAKEKRH